MALATQCPHCHTTFRVAHDQLKLRAGIVRCGQCQQVFNGIEHLLPPAGLQQAARTAAPETETETSTMDGPVLPEAPLSANMPMRAESGSAEALQEPDYCHAPEQITLIRFPQAEQRLDPESPCPDIAPREQAAPKAVQQINENTGAAPAGSSASGARDRLPADTQQVATPSFEGDAQEEPGFVTAARRQRHKERRTRLLFGAGSAILALVLLMQASYALRNQIAAHIPQTKPALLAICRTLGCSIALPAQIDAISIESSELQAQPGAPGTMVLTLLLRNRSSTAQAWPNIELTLNEGNEHAVLRRVFTPPEFPVSAADTANGIAANTERAIRLSFTLTGLKASGYRIVLFYP